MGMYLAYPSQSPESVTKIARTKPQKPKANKIKFKSRLVSFSCKDHSISRHPHGGVNKWLDQTQVLCDFDRIITPCCNSFAKNYTMFCQLSQELSRIYVQ